MNFYGPEKRLEVQIRENTLDLRDLPDNFWQKLVRAAGTNIVDKQVTDVVISFILSESSLFVWSNRLVLLTCGNTYPFAAVSMLLEKIAAADIIFWRCEQKGTANWPLNEKEFYTFSQGIKKSFPQLHYQNIINETGDTILFCQAGHTENDSTKNINQFLLQGLNCHPNNDICFTAKEHPSNRPVILRQIFPEALHHYHNFSPCGYSENGLLGNGYYALHITPEKEHSYVGFDTDLDLHEHQYLLEHLLTIFKPSTMSVISFSDKKTLQSKITEYRLTGQQSELSAHITSFSVL